MPQLVAVDNEGITDPHVNLAIEEYALRNLDARFNYLLFYVNEPSIIVGRSQRTTDVMDGRYVKERGIHVVRRLSGGGAVYHDEGNLNFSFITDYGPGRLHNFGLFTGPIARVLQAMGVKAELGGRNDLVVDGRKVSGNAQFSTPRRMFSHGTLLFNSDLGEVGRALRVKADKLQPKGLTTVQSRVANIAEFAEREMDVPTFRQRILEGLFAGGDVRRYRLTGNDWEGVRRLVDERYGRWDWNVGGAPPFNVQRARRFSVGEIDVRLDVRKGRIAGARLFGDVLDDTGFSSLARRLEGVPFDREALESVLNGSETGVTGLSAPDLVSLLDPELAT